MDKLDLSLVLPVHNQETIITPVVQEINQVLKKAGIKNEIILVENGSTDNTLTVVKNLARRYKNIKSLTAPKGYGSAIIAGLALSRGRFVSYMPSDGQLDPKLIPKLFKLIKSGRYDLVKIKRVTRESFIRTIRSKIFNFLSSLLFKIPVSDINGSPRIFLRKWLPILDLQYKDSFIDCEMAIKAYFLKWKIKEIPAQTLPRLGGKSTVNFRTIIEFLKNLLAYRFGKELKYWLKNNG